MPPRVYVGVGLATYLDNEPLPQAVTTTRALAALLREEHEFSTSPPVLDDLPRGELLDHLDAALAPGSCAGGVLLVGWTGHGVVGADGTLRLVARGVDRDVEAMDAAALAERALATNAAQALLLLDVCFAGGGVAEALAAARAIGQHQRDIARRWFGVLAACRGDELALAGALPRHLERLLREGPRAHQRRLHWLVSGRSVRADLALQDLVAEWDDPYQSPEIASTGEAREVFRNVLFPATDGIVEHLLNAARSTTTDDNFFVGRADPIRRITAWVHDAPPGALVITGPPGCGKSALLGRIVSLADPAERRHIAEREELHPELDVGEGTIHAHLHLRRLDVEQVVQRLWQQLAAPHEPSRYGLLAYAEQRARADDPLVIALDALDEMAMTDSRLLVDDLLVPLLAHAKVLLASRQTPALAVLEGPLPTLARPPEVLDLGAAPEDTLVDVRSYVTRRLEGVDEAMDAEAVADAVVEEASGFVEEGPFLFARLLTSQLREAPMDTSAAGWRDRLATSVAAALERDVCRVILDVDGHPHPTAARELMTALAWAEGAGFPADDDLWPLVATALSPSGTRYERGHVMAVLDGMRRHLVTAAQDDSTAFRIAHQRLVEHLRGRDAPGDRDHVARAAGEHYRRLLSDGAEPSAHPYLWLHAWRHLADAGEEGITLLRDLVQRASALEPDLSLALERVAEVASQEGDMTRAVDALSEAVEIRRRLEPEGSARLALLLIELGSARLEAGDVEGSTLDTEAGTTMARKHTATAEGRGALIAALSGRAVSRARAGEFHAAARQIEEALSLLADSGLDEEAATIVEISLRSVISGITLVLLETDEAAAHAARLRELTENVTWEGDRYRHSIVLLGHAALLRVEVLTRIVAMSGPGAAAPEPIRDRDVVTVALALEPTDQQSALARLEALNQALLARGQGLTHPDDVEAHPTEHLLDALGETVAAVEHASTDVTLAVSGALLTRAMFAGEDGAEDLAGAEELLRSVINTDSNAAWRLASLLDYKARLLGASSAALEALVEGVDLLEALGTVLADQMRCELLLMIVGLAAPFGDLALLLRAVDAAARIVRERPEIRAQRPELWVAALTEASAVVMQGRALEGQQAGEEALAAIATLPAGPLATVRRVQALTNIGNALMLQERFDEAALRLHEAIEADGADQLDPSLLAHAYFNLADIGLRLEPPGDERTLSYARQALELAESSSASPTARHLLLGARVSLAVALHGAGQADAAATQLHEAVEGMVQLLQSDPATVPEVAVAANRALWGVDPWEPLLRRDELDAELRGLLELHRLFHADRAAAAVALTISQLEAAGTDELVMAIRQRARLQRARAPELFDAAWREATGRLDDWLTVPRRLTDLVIAWWNTDTWSESEAFLRAHEELLDPRTDLLIEEVGAGRPEWLVAGHRDALAAARAGDPEAGFAILRARELVADWLDSSDPVDFIREHIDAVAPAVLDETIEEFGSAVHRATVALVRRGEHVLADDALHAGPDWTPLLDAAMASTDAERLRALGVLCLANERAAAAERSVAYAAVMLAAVLDGTGDDELPDLLEARRGDDDAGDASATRTALLEALPHHPEHAAAIATLAGELGPTAAAPASSL